MNNFAGIANNVSVADVIFSQTITASNTLLNFTAEASVLTPGATGPYQTVALATFPGLGLRWKFAGYEDVSNAAINTGMLPSVGAVITNSASYWINAKFTSNATPKKYKLKWKFELVVTDLRAYAGGMGDFSRETSLNAMQVLSSIGDVTAPIVHQACSPVLSGFAQALGAGGVIALPELPKPPTPTCQFPIGTLNQTIALNPVSGASVPASGSLRASASNETRFQINANNCGANTDYAIYFTDANAAGASKDYLITAGALANKVNLRMYQGAGSAPIQFGPAPTGSSLPPHSPGLVNSNTPANSNFIHDFYVQYVRAPGVDASQVTPGSLTAKMIITVMYP
ncbi:fimbrial protein [Comamonas testosteroni]|uniref:fimbrial protein n=1 Tax=Comamonas testosteroni TaxID=285 RepID=UPI0005B32DB1|nr:type 1 fimbrial protein [Comamonas testosteroni]